MLLNHFLIHYPQKNVQKALLDDLFANKNYNQLLKNEALYTGIFKEDSLKISIADHHQNQRHICIKLNVFFQEMMTTCPCSGDEPDLYNGYCDITLIIDKTNHSVKIIPSFEKN